MCHIAKIIISITAECLRNLCKDIICCSKLNFDYPFYVKAPNIPRISEIFQVFLCEQDFPLKSPCNLKLRFHNIIFSFKMRVSFLELHIFSSLFHYLLIFVFGRSLRTSLAKYFNCILWDNWIKTNVEAICEPFLRPLDRINGRLESDNTCKCKAH